MHIVWQLTPPSMIFIQISLFFTSGAVLKRYNLGTSANIKNLKDSCLKKDIIDILPSKKIVLQDPMFAYWLKQQR